ncbi:hypothetical protein Droror1_Dr00002752 [Drosera rotundifolia]
MAKWPLRGATSRKFHIKINNIKLHLQGEYDGKSARVLAVEVKWRGASKSGFVVPSFNNKKSSSKREVSGEKLIGRETDEAVIEWEEEFENFCSFSSKEEDDQKGLFSPSLVSFSLLAGEKQRSKGKPTRIGKGFLNLGELASKKEPVIETTVSISTQIDGVHRKATLSLAVSFAEVRAIIKSSSNSMSDLLDLVPYIGKKAKDKGEEEEEVLVGYSSSSSYESASSVFENEYGIVTNGQDMESNSVRELQSSVGSETQLAMFEKAGFWKWKRRSIAKTHEDLTEKSSAKMMDASPVFSRNLAEGTEAIDRHAASCSSGSWETKELISRDGKAILTSEVFFASYDQRSEKAAGGSACASIVTVMAHWLRSNQDILPTRAEFDNLIVEGSSEWRKLLEVEANRNMFHDGHFDLETVVLAELRPLSVSQEQSFIGFFSPEKFEYLKEAQSFDKIWDKIKDNADDFESHVYIVSWNDHFFVLKVEADAYYIIDSLGERLHEGCNQAYILRFDESSLMYAKTDNEEDEGEEIICAGKECCREYIKRFLAAIHVAELQEAEENGTVSIHSLFPRLQIEFHFMADTSARPSTSSALMASPDSPFFLMEECIEA